MKLPKINFRYSFIYDKCCRDLFPIKIFYPSETVIKKKIREFEKEWNKISKKVLMLIAKYSSLKWGEETIISYVRGRCVPISDPLTISLVKNKSNRYLSKRNLTLMLIHELCHNIFNKNKKSRKFILKKLKSRFKKENTSILEHIFVLAIQKEVGVELYGEKFTNNYISAVNSYKRAWYIIKRDGFKIF